MKLYLRTILITSTLLIVLNCNDDKDNNINTNNSKNNSSPIESSTCDFFTIIDNIIYETADSYAFGVNSYQITDNCLSVTFSASGCDGESWQFKLVTSEAVGLSYPPQYALRVIFENNEDCLAVITKTVTFDLSPLNIENNNEAMLSIEGFPESIWYNY